MKYYGIFNGTSSRNRVLVVWLLLIVLLVSGCSMHAAGGDTLVLQQGDDTFLDQKHGVEWRLERSGYFKTAEDVEHYLQGLNKEEGKQWRLPTKQELSDLFSSFDLKLNGEVKIQLEGRYWLQDDGKDYVGSWQIGDQCGPSRSFYREKSGYVRAVRDMQ
ncbi:hypothetical protein [Desulfosediminicola sp.]|uniref:hypothetical protein n=1 Tax=Desulfosediminicola sp. TaxID=2886825 RepID=UPI003AF2328B